MRGIAGSASSQLFERERELAEFAAAFGAAAAGSGALVVVDAPAGLGKSTLLSEACRRADALGFRVLRARGDTLAADHPWSVATQLFGEVPQASTGGHQTPHDPFPLIHGLYRATASLAEHAPLVLALDDVHWCDPLTLQFVHHLAGRLDTLRVVVAVTHRTAEPVPQQVADQLRRIAASPGARLCTLRPLGPTAVSELVAAVAPDAAEPCRSAIYDATGGNPFFACELIRTAHAESLPLDDPATAEVLRTVRPSAIRASIGVRLSALGPEASAVAEAVALLGGSARTHSVAALAGLDRERIAEAIDRLVAAGLLAHPGASTEEPVRFVHPVVADVVYGDLGPARTARGHLRCAEYLRDTGAPPSEVADHLLRAEPCHETWVVEQLVAAGEVARARRAPHRAVDVWRRAIDLCRDPERRGELTMRLAGAELGLGHDAGHARVAEAVAALPLVAQRLPATQVGEFALALYAHGRFVEARTAFDAALSASAGVDPVTEATLVAGLEMAGLLAAEPSERARTHLGRALADDEYDGSLAGRVLAALAAGHVALGVELDASPADRTGRERVLDLLRRAGAESLPPSLGPTVLEPVAIALWLCDEFDAARSLLGPAIDCATRDGELVTYSSLLPLRSMVNLGTGQLTAAIDDAAEAIRLSHECAAPNAIARGPAEHALVSAALETAERDVVGLVDRDPPDAGGRPPSPIDGWHLHALGRLALAEGRPADALDLLLLAGDRFRSAGGPGAYCEWRIWAAAAARAVGAATQAAELADDELRWAERFGAPRAISRALRSRARTLRADDAIELLRRAVTLVEGSPARLERAHAHVELGALLRRWGRRAAAREHLREGLDEARRCGATELVGWATDELERSGARRIAPARRGVAALTPSESQVARLAAEGRTNPEIAAAMFVSRKTVEVHLTNTYRKLGIRGRAELAGALEAEPSL